MIQLMGNTPEWNMFLEFNANLQCHIDKFLSNERQKMMDREKDGFDQQRVRVS